MPSVIPYTDPTNNEPIEAAFIKLKYNVYDDFAKESDPVFYIYRSKNEHDIGADPIGTFPQTVTPDGFPGSPPYDDFKAAAQAAFDALEAVYDAYLRSQIPGTSAYEE